MIDYSKINWNQVLEFESGVPYLCGIRVGDDYDEANNRENEIGERIGWYDKAFQVINDMSLSFEFMPEKYNENYVGEMYMYLPVDEYTSDSVKALISYIDENLYTENKDSSFTYDADDNLKDLDAYLENDLYIIEIFKKLNIGTNTDYIEVHISGIAENKDTYKCINALLDDENEDLTKFATRIINGK